MGINVNGIIDDGSTLSLGVSDLAEGVPLMVKSNIAVSHEWWWLLSAVFRVSMTSSQKLLSFLLGDYPS